MTPDPDSVETLFSTPNEIEAAAIVTALAGYGIEALATGGYTWGFRAEAPGLMAVVVKHADLDRAKQALAEIRQQLGETDWSNVDVMEGAEKEPLPEDAADAAPDWSPLRLKRWWILEIQGIAVCIIVWLFTREPTRPLAYIVAVLVAIAFVLLIAELLVRRDK